MTDNSQYPFGFDVYYQNKIPSWNKLLTWDQKIQFMYYRLGIGVQEDDPTLLQQAAQNTTWKLGVYYALWTPSLPRDRQLQTITDQLAKIGNICSLPVALDFEPEVDYVKGHPVVSWPSVGDLKYISDTLSAQGYKTLVYTNLSGLDVIKGNGALDLKNTDWWIARYYGFPLWSSEMSVDDTLTLLLAKYGIPKGRVQFMQTLGDHGAWPDGTTGADYDRAVSYDLGSIPVPPPAPVPVLHEIVVNVLSDAKVELASVTADGNDLTNISTLNVNSLTPAPIPTPTSQGKANRYRILYDFEQPVSYTGGVSRTAQATWTGNPITPATCRIRGIKSNYILTPLRVAAITKINLPYPNGLKYISAHSGGWVNSTYWPQVEALTFEGNVVDVISIDAARGRAYIRMWNGEDGSGMDDECVIHHWTNIGRENQIYTGSWKGPAFIALMYEPGWIELDKLVKVT